MLISRSTFQLRCLAGLVLSVWLAATASRVASAPLFAAPFLSFDTGSLPSFVAIGDLSGDGKPDLAVANLYTSTISVFLGNGDGSFAAKTDYGVGDYPRSVAIGDLNADGKPDLVVANSGLWPAYGTTVSVLLGNGGGSFAPKTDFVTGGVPYSVAIGDLNGDGKPDLVVARGGAVSVLLGNGDGSFGPTADFPADDAEFLAIGDLNGDGKLDVATTNGSASAVSILLGNG
ncbi:MAG TPA: VCBS repeat-containing protein, partial [Gaiellales bacterium]|nr:VCBS repeat-containing protein [Gaiellales bacterium]